MGAGVSEVEYKFVVYTGDEAGAGTDANVKFTLIGESGDSGELHLDRKTKNDFERGAKDSFFYKLKPLGKLFKLKVSHDGSGFGSAWYLNKVGVGSCLLIFNCLRLISNLFRLW